MRLKDRELSLEATMDIVKKGIFGTLAISEIEGYAYSVPLNYVVIDDVLYFHCAKQGKKLEGILGHPNVSFSVVTLSNVKESDFTTEYESAILFGKAYKVEKHPEIMAALKALIAKYSPNYIGEGDVYIEKFIQATAVVGINIEALTGKSND